jgi:outer membrane protein OmpA-like peptidoglycan-associated protein
MNKTIASITCAPNSLRRAGLLLTLVASVALSACQTMGAQEKGTAAGAGVGAVAGAVLSKITGGKATTGAVVGGAAGAVIGNVWSKKMEDQKRAMEQASKGTGVQVSQTADNQLKLNIPSDISFDSGKSSIKPELRAVLDNFAQSLTDQTNSVVRVVGHTDSSGSNAINEPLSLARANAVREHLAARGVAATRMTTEGHGSREPLVSNDTSAGRSQNRRVEIFVREPSGS